MEDKYQITYNPELAKIISELNVVLAISTYQASRLIFITANRNKIHQIPVPFKKPMGVAIKEGNLAVATLKDIQIYSGSKTLAKKYPKNPDMYDVMFVPRATYYCGETDLHDLEFGKNNLWAVNTLFSCLSTFDINHSFTPRWKPNFISTVIPEDRCHLNGMAMKDGMPAYVTALGQGDKKESWRENITEGGVLMNIPKGDILMDKLPMPHSPRIIGDDIYCLLSATGEIIKINQQEYSYQVVDSTQCFVRGLAVYDDYLFVATSKIRTSSKLFRQLPVADTAKSAGLLVYKISTGQQIGEIKYLSTVDEIYDVKVLPDIKRPGLLNIYNEMHEQAIVTPSVSVWRKPKPKKDVKEKIENNE